MISDYSKNIIADLKGPKRYIIYTMDGVQGELLGPPHGTTTDAVIENKNRDSFRAVSILIRNGMGHTTVSATKASSLTLQIWQHDFHLHKAANQGKRKHKKLFTIDKLTNQAKTFL